jgi:membrane associated rhomboid family serine protease
LPGILLVQILTVFQVSIALYSSSLVVFISFGFLSLILSGLIAVWFSLIAAHPQQDVNATLSPKHKGRRRTTRKSGTKQDSTSEATLDSPQFSKLSRLSGIPLAGIMGLAGLGALVLLSQLITVSLLIFGTVGGAIAGYTWRMRQELRHQGGLVIIDAHSRVPNNHWPQAQRVYTSDPKQQESPHKPPHKPTHKPPIDISP